MDVKNLFNMKNKPYAMNIKTPPEEEELDDPYVLEITGKT